MNSPPEHNPHHGSHPPDGASPDVAGQGLSLRTVAAGTLIVIVITALAAGIWQLSSLMLLGFGAILIAIFLRALADWGARWTGMSAGWSLLAVVVVLMGSLGAAFYLGGQAFATQISELADRVPKSLEKIREDMSQYEWGRWVVRRLHNTTDDVQVSNQELATYASGALTSATGVLGGAVVVLFLALYLAYQPRPYIEGFLRLIPVGKRDRVAEVLAEVHTTLRGWLFGVIISMALVGVLTSVGLSLLGVQPALALGGIAAILTFIPNFGPVISAIPAVLLAFVESPTTALYVVALYLGIQTVESYLITPVIQREAADVPPVLTIVAQVGLGILWGIAGVVLATPLVAAVLVLVQRLYVEDFLEGAGNS